SQRRQRRDARLPGEVFAIRCGRAHRISALVAFQKYETERRHAALRRFKTAIMIPPPVQADFVGFARKLRRIFLPTIVFVGVTLATDPAYSQFVLTPTPGLPGVSAGSVAWGD